MFAKILIKGRLEVLTGMHIGAGGDYAAIGAVDSPVVRDRVTNLPIIPGSTLKGKIRSLIVKEFCPTSTNPTYDNEVIKRIFGGDFGQKKKTGRLIFSDSPLANLKELKEMYIDSPTEVKFENTINRLTGVAMPRQIERIIRGCEFDVEMVYEISGDVSEVEVIEDIKTISEGLKLLQYDYLGGNGTRGYGKVKMKNMSAKAVVGRCDYIEKLNSIIEGALI